MHHPLFSLITASLIWIFFAAIFSYAIFSQTKVRSDIEVEATLIEEVSRPIAAAKKIIVKDEFGVKQATKISNNKDDSKNKIAAVVARPLPQIPDELRQEAFNSYAIARFYIAVDGSTTVELIKPCANPRLNNLLLKSLKNWKFFPAKINGVATSSTQDIRVNFKVE